ncbi:MAG: hypothetical protein ACYCZX_19435 [Rhodospirillaceae bacterium]
MIRKISHFRSLALKRERVPSSVAIAVWVFAYFFGALGVCALDPVVMLAVWLLGGLLVLTAYFTFEPGGRKSN